MARIFRALCALFVLVSGVAIMLIIYYSTPGRFWFWEPQIDTYYAEYYTEEAFVCLQQGMTKEQVWEQLGYPLAITPGIGELNAPNTIWIYTADGRCEWWNFAWEVRCVYFQYGRVAYTYSSWAYD